MLLQKQLKFQNFLTFYRKVFRAEISLLELNPEEHVTETKLVNFELNVVDLNI